MEQTFKNGRNWCVQGHLCELGGLKVEAGEGERTEVCSPWINYDRKISEGV